MKYLLLSLLLTLSPALCMEKDEKEDNKTEEQIFVFEQHTTEGNDVQQQDTCNFDDSYQIIDEMAFEFTECIR